jgi:protease-4
MKQFLITVAGVFVGLTLFAIALPMTLLAIAEAATRPAPLPARTVLVLDLRGGVSDQDPQNPLSLFGGKAASVMRIERTLRAAEADARVRALFVRAPDAGIDPAAADELREAFKRFRAAGKPILVHSQGFYPEGMITSTYELAAASGDLWMQPASSFQVTGAARQDIFFKRLFDHYGVSADYQQRYEYKNAVNPYLFSDYTPAHRASELSWLGSVYETALDDAAQDRGLGSAALKAVIEAGPWSAEDAKARGLVDQIGQVKDAERAILAKAGKGAKLSPFGDYAAGGHASDGLEGGPGSPTLAVISGEGEIVTGTARHASPLDDGKAAMHSDDVARAFYAAIEDSDVKAIVFRVSSPGGSDTASEQIAAAVRAARAAGKPVVVSMGTYGASGGYWISSGASAIVAEPTTLTGSIGVFGGKFVLGPALARLGVDVRDLKVGGDYADAFSPGAAMSATQRAAFSAWMDRIYAGFVARVAEGRRLPVPQVEAMARGRVWTGAQAKALGLVDELGGFYQAVDRAKALAGIKGAAHLATFSTQASPFEALGRLFGAGAEGAQTLGAALWLAGDPNVQALLADARQARLREQGATVLAPRLLP